MSERHARKKRRPRFQKPDTINIILGSLTVILLLTWGGLHWKESSQQSLIVNAGSAAMNEYAELLEVGPITDNAGSSNSAEVTKPAENANALNEQAGNKQEVKEQEQAGQTVGPAATDKATPPEQTTKPSSTAETTPAPSLKPSAGSGTGTGAKPAPETTKAPVVPNITETKPPVPISQKYEQEMNQLHAKCTSDMNGVLAGADKRLQQLDMNDPYAFQELTEEWMDGLAVAESACTTKFNEVIENAANEDVDPDKIESWEETFSALLLQLQGEFEAKLLQLMSG